MCRYVFILCVGCASAVLTSHCYAQRLPALPGPALDIPVDLDGDGESTFGDKYVFNHWLSLGGDLTKAILATAPAEEVLQLREFFHSSQAALEKSSPLQSNAAGSPLSIAPAVAAGGGQAAAMGGCTTNGTLVAPFDVATATQVFIGHCDSVLLGKPRGQVIVNGDLFVAHANTNGVDAGVTRIAGIDSNDQDPFPFGSGSVSSIITGLNDINLMDYDPTNDDLVATSTNVVQTGTAVYRISDLTSSATSCSVVEFPPTGPLPIKAPYGIHYVDNNPTFYVCGVSQDDFLVTDAWSFVSAVPPLWGFLGGITSAACGGVSTVTPLYRGMNIPTGFDVGNFNIPIGTVTYLHCRD